MERLYNARFSCNLVNITVRHMSESQLNKAFLWFCKHMFPETCKIDFITEDQ